jgi:signal transduction histidine kinase
MDEADQIVDRLTDTIRITRSLARGLSPVEIEAGGLGVALAGLVRSSSELLSIECELELPDELPPLSPQVATQFYRIAQECITNAAKHGQAPVVRVSLAEKNGSLLMRVSNNGKPFPPAAKDSHGMGLHIMRHRAESMDASLDFELQPPDASFAVRCELPLPANLSTTTDTHEKDSH